MMHSSPAVVDIKLVPWDPAEVLQIERMRQQRTVCGWNVDAVSSWAVLQQTGGMNMFWAVLSSPFPGTNQDLIQELERKHLAAYPDESVALGRVAAPVIDDHESESSVSFVPVGHVSLVRPLRPGHQPEDPIPAPPPENPLIISNLYVSPALQGLGLGGKVLDAVQRVAGFGPPPEIPVSGSGASVGMQEKPRNWKAGVLLLYTVEGVAQKNKARYEALALNDMPKVALEDWYQRKGYVVTRRIESVFDKTDSTGTLWPAAAVEMRLMSRE